MTKPSKEPLAGVHAKLSRAAEHVSQLAPIAAELSRSMQGHLVCEDEPATGMRSYRVASLPVIPIRYGAVLGDVVHNLRSALDHLAFALCAAGPSGSDTAASVISKIAFPVPGSAAAREPEFLAHPALLLLERLGRPGVADAVREIQPFIGGRSEVLQHLAVLDNIDKHRLVFTTTSATPPLDVVAQTLRVLHDVGGSEKLSQMKDSLRAFPPMFLRVGRPERLEVGDVFLRENVNHDLGPLERVHIPIAFDEADIGGVVPVGEFLEKAAAAVKDAVARLKPYV